MAMSCVIRKASRRVVRAIASPRILFSFVIKPPTTAEHGGGDAQKRSFLFSHHYNFSTVPSDVFKRVDRKIIKALKSETKSHDPSDIKMPKAPSGFPFQIEDIPGEDGIKLTSDFAGEKIVVNVYDPIYPKNWPVETTDVSNDAGGGSSSADNSLTDSAADKSSTNSSDDDDPEKASFSFDEPRIQLTLNISKENGTTLRIYLWANVGYVGHPEIFIDDAMRVSNEMSFDKEDCWRKFIRVRGIDDSIGEFLMDYMNKRSDRDYLLFLKKVRDFVEE